MTIKEKVNQDKVLEHQLEEWRNLNAYLNKIDTEYRQLLVMAISILAILATLISEKASDKALLGIVIIPPGIVAVLVFWSYQSRITAILRGRLSALEEKINDTLGERVHMWNSALTETFMARNNKINKYMIIPVSILMAVLLVLCFDISQQAFATLSHAKIWLAVYWTAIAVCLVIIVISLCTNERVRRETFHEEKVWEIYDKYMKEPKMQTSYFKYEEAKLVEEEECK